ncbi:unnamed protein product [Enterobius vermicularis]|uniref:ANK_REP_REGION domain-containing protein n=1 Tax=Enterobius vermicularis TaxID=51028 RepID=A0A158QAT2_ENTVE|nr:unnamed protein product [Enterobius vermicularis]
MEFFGSGRTPRLGEYKNIGLYGIDQLAAAGTEKAKKTLETLLLIACEKGQANSVRYLAERGANVNGTDDYGWTPLMIATQSGQNGIVTYLMEKGAETEAVNKNGWTTLMIACKNGRFKTVKHLLSKYPKLSEEADNEVAFR